MLIPATDDKLVGRKTLAPWKLQIGKASLYDEPIYAYPTRSIGGTHPLGTLAITALVSPTNDEPATLATFSEILEEDINDEFAGARSRGELRDLFKAYFLHSGVCDGVHVNMSKELITNIVTVCETIRNKRKTGETNRETGRTADKTSVTSEPILVESEGSAAHHNPGQPVSLQTIHSTVLITSRLRRHQLKTRLRHPPYRFRTPPPLSMYQWHLLQELLCRLARPPFPTSTS